MGNCRSKAPKSLLIMHDGRLEEYSYPIRVSQMVSSKKLNPSLFFICNADEMEFDAFVRGLARDDTLELGQLYFELPVSTLKRPLRGEEIAELAVKAISTIKNCKKILGFHKAAEEKMRQTFGVRTPKRGSKWVETLGSVPE